ncbi:MAG TPA: hypothetical protein VK175_13945 [Leadbetterella sp.]|nr:hypothetical protein [Leadbetterella sp.]
MKMFALFLSLILLSCESNEVKPSVVGSWKWVESQGGIAGLTIKASESDQREMIFDAKGNFTMIQNGKTITQAKYELKNAKSITSTELKPMITFPNEDAMNLSYEITGNNLYLFEEVYDGFSHTYVRK